ncbi:hypothetical protein PRIPAC_74895 [Pristionchus pacificus]|uniref:Uncharacterized protein n=1 Tax=Pristionchus pacificus TaxID=54126 RepID=A0A454XJ14_PRIPA|nr:hypothetical protein PRIPAC_74895 [Pristionchus pacificus]|eukprot:PDM74997.1 hypothetical protein PRIPAC_40378 [Pristionchus pacificus]
MMLLLVASLLTTAAAFPFEITPQPLFPVPDPTPAEPCGLAARACIAAVDCASGFCNIAPGAATGCCQDTQWPEPGAQPTPPPFEDSACPVNVPLCVNDNDCGFSGYCNHTEARHNFFGCCQFGPGPTGGPEPFPFPTGAPFPFPSDGPFPFPSDGPGPFPFPVTAPAPTGDICPPWINLCIADADCEPGDSCSHSSSNSDVFGCCHAGVVDPVDPIFPTFPPFPFPDPVPTLAPAEICPASVALCIADAECGPGQECSHTVSNSDVFGCCQSVDGFAPSTIPPFIPVEEQPRCAAELACIADADCSLFGARCDFIFGSPMGCCTPNQF